MSKQEEILRDCIFVEPNRRVIGIGEAMSRLIEAGMRPAEARETAVLYGQELLERKRLLTPLELVKEALDRELELAKEAGDGLSINALNVAISYVNKGLREEGKCQKKR